MAVTINGTTGILAPDIGIDGTTLTVDAVNNRVGIANSSPGTPLDVVGIIQSDTGLQVAGHPVIGYSTITGGYAARLGSTGSTTLNKTQIYARGAHVATFDGANGNVGIGITDPLNKLTIKDDSATSTGIFIHNSNGSTNSSADLWFGNWSGSTSGTPQAHISALNKNVNTAATDLIFKVYTGNTTEERLRITSAGEINIPYGVINLGTAGTSSGHLNSTELMTFNIDTDSNSSSRYFAWYKNGKSAGGTEMMRLNEDARLCIGGDLAPSGNHITLKSAGDVEIDMNSTATGNNFRLKSNSGGIFTIRDHSAGVDRITIRDDGKIGIGNNNPLQFFSVQGRMNIDHQGDYYGAWIDGDSNGTSSFNVGMWYNSGGQMSNDGNNLVVKTQNTSHHLLLQPAGGKVGIGITVPQNALHINGSSPSIRLSDTGANGSAFSIIEDNDGLLKFRNDAGNSGTGSGIAFEVDASEKLRIESSGIVNVTDRIYSPNIQHTPFILTASEKAVELWQHSYLSYSSSEEAFKFNRGSSYLSKSFFFGYNIDGAKGYDFEITGKNVTGRFYMKLYYSDGTDSGNWSINAWNPSSFSRNTISVPTNKKVRGFHINTSSSTSGYEIYIKEIKIRRKSTDTNAPRDINVPDPVQFLSVMGGDTGVRQAVRSISGYTAGGSREAGFLALAASSGNNNISTGINVNASNAGGAMMVLATRNTSNSTATDAGMYLLMFRYDGDHVPNVVHIGGDNFCTFGKNGSNYLTVNCGSGNWCVSGFFAGYGIGSQLH